MAGSKEIVNRIKSVKNTKKITYAMKLVSATKLRKAQAAVESARDYNNALVELLAKLAQNDLEISHPFLEKRSVKKIALIVVGGSRGLCGAYNSNINKAVERFYKENAGVEIDSFLLGKKAAEYYRKRGKKYVKAYEQLADNPNHWPLEEIAFEIEDKFSYGNYDAVFLIYTRFKSAMSVFAETQILLPVDSDALLADVANSSKNNSAVIFEPSAASVFNALLPRMVRGKVRQACLESKASEQGSRMTAMDSATKNASELIDSLTLTYNKLRQSGITSQLLDIMGGAEGLK